MEKRISCPRCEQGWILEVEIIPLARNAYMCEECEALWFDKRKIGSTGFVDFGDYMERLGHKGLWTELKIRGPATHDD